jgi:hypothetical protein
MFWVCDSGRRLGNFLLGLVCILDGMVLMLTLGCVGTHWQFRYMAAQELRRLKKTTAGTP